MHLKVSTSSLGGTKTVFFHAAAEPKECWTNGIFHNAHYGIFSLDNGKLSLISKHYEMPKFRKCKCADVNTAQQKIETWISKWRNS